MSFADTPSPNAPSHSSRIVCGTFSQISPVTSTPSISVAPMPNMYAPNAPPVGEWLSPPTHEHPRPEVALLRQHDVADSDAVVEARHARVLHPFARGGDDPLRLVVVRRQVVVGDHHHLLRVPDLRAEPLEHRLHPPRAARVVHHARSTLQVTISPGVTSARPAARATSFWARVLRAHMPEVGPLQVAPRQQLRRRAVERDRAVLQHVGAVRDLERLRRRSARPAGSAARRRAAA